MPALYALDDGTAISTNSMLQTFRRCPKKADYKYHQRLKPKVVGTPLYRGVWMHSLLEAYHGGQDWLDVHREYVDKYDQLFDEEREDLGDLPRECRRLMKSYIWHYAEAGDWEVIDVEVTIECEFPDGSIFRGKVDAIIRWNGKLWFVDHKTHKRMPDFTFRLLDTQSALYLKAAELNGLDVQGFIWNYLITKPPTVPKLVYVGTSRERLSTREITTDYITFRAALKKYGIDPSEHAETLRYLKAMRYKPGEPQLSPFFYRSILEKSPEVLDRVFAENFHTARRMHAYDFTGDDVERVPSQRCTFDCREYKDICSIELLGGDTRLLRKQKYRVGDPLEYYEDRAGERPDQEEVG